MFGLSFLTPTLLKWGGIALAVLAVVLYIGTLRVERNHYKASAEKWETTYYTYRAHVEANVLALKESNAALTLQAKQSSIEVMKVQNDAKAKLLTRISNDQVSANIRIPASVMQLQHDTTTNATDISKPADSIGGHATDSQQASEGSVHDLLVADAINNAELNVCVDEVVKWNGFWDTFVSNVKAVEHAQP